MCVHVFARVLDRDQTYTYVENRYACVYGRAYVCTDSVSHITPYTYVENDYTYVEKGVINDPGIRCPCVCVYFLLHICVRSIGGDRHEEDDWNR